MSVHWSLRFSSFLFLASCFEEEGLEDVLFFAHEREWRSSWVCFEDDEVVVNVFEMISMMKTANGTNWPNSNQISIIFVAESSGSFAEIPPESHEQICFHWGNYEMLMIMYYCKSVCTTHLSQGLSDLKQKCTQLRVPFLGTIFNALLLGFINFVRSAWKTTF